MGLVIAFVAHTALSTAWLFPGLQSSCAATPIEDRLPSVIAAMAGTDPVWLVTDERWEPWAKSALVLSRRATGSLHVEGHRLDGPGTLRFQDGAGAPVTDAFVIDDPWGRRSVKPFGASVDILASYAFIMLMVNYPSPGCWQFDVQLGIDRVRIVRDVK